MNEINENIIEKTIYCPNCNNKLSCYGYMINGNITCRFCENKFVLNRELWNKSFKIVLSECKTCKSKTENAVIEHDIKNSHITLECLQCRETTIIKY